MKLSENIRELRKEKNLRQEQLAEAMGVSTASVSKWETGQCAPELTVLMDLADFFQVSVDTLMGHSLNGSRMDRLLGELEEAVKNREETNAAQLCETLLRCYPNDANVVEACAANYYRMSVCMDNPAYMERSIEQTKRLMELKRGEPEKVRLERLHQLGNQYALMKQWDTAMDYYDRSNVGGYGNASIAQCLQEQGNNREAIVMLSEALLKSVFSSYQAVNTLADGWLALGEPEKACGVLNWIFDTMATLGYNPTLRMLTQVKLMDIYRDMGQEEAAVQALRLAAGQLEMPDTRAEFLLIENEQDMLMSGPGNDRELLKQITEKLGAPYVQVLKEVLA